MLTPSNAKENPASGITPPPNSRMPWRIGRVEALPDWKLKVRFSDGLEGLVDMQVMVHAPNAGVFSALADPVYFNQVYVVRGVVTWPGEIDLATDTMYDAIKKSGNWVIAP